MIHSSGKIALASAIAVLVGVITPGVAVAQMIPRDSVARDSVKTDSTVASKASVDSLVARLERTEAALELLKQQVATESGTNVRTRSRLQADVWARVLMNGFVSHGSLNSSDVPTYATDDAPAAAGVSNRAAGLSLRQSRVGLSVFVDSVAGATFDGDFELDFFGGQTPGTQSGYLFPEPRLRAAKLSLRWPRTELLLGGETPLISPLNPVTVASVGVPGFSAAGNLWNWLPQVRLTRELGATPLGGASLRWAIQGAVLHPFSGIQLAGEEYGVDAGVRSGRPYLESRLRAQWGADARPEGASPGESGGEVGVGVHRGWIRTSDSTLAASEAFSADARIGLPLRLELRGEAYGGRALAGLGGGGIEQNFGIAPSGSSFGAPLRDVGGWAQVNWQAHPAVLTGVGCGIDAPAASDKPDRMRNASCAAHVLWRPAQPLLFGFEVRHLRTDYASRIATGTHFNFTFGFEL